MAQPIWQWSAVDTAKAIRAGKITVQEAVDAALGRMMETNAAVNAVTVDLSDDAQRAARRADGIVKSGLALGPLHGVPITIKENVDQRGQSTTNGVPTGLHDGIPMGVQIIGPRFREDLCLDAAEAVERGTGILSQQLWSKT